MAHVANHVFDRVSDPALLAHVKEMEALMCELLAGVQRRSPKVRAVRGRGLMWGVDVTEPAKDVVGRALEQGLLLVGAGEHTIRLLPPLVISAEALTEGVGRLERAIG